MIVIRIVRFPCLVLADCSAYRYTNPDTKARIVYCNTDHDTHSSADDDADSRVISVFQLPVPAG